VIGIWIDRPRYGLGVDFFPRFSRAPITVPTITTGDERVTHQTISIGKRFLALVRSNATSVITPIAMPTHRLGTINHVLSDDAADNAITTGPSSGNVRRR